MLYPCCVYHWSLHFECTCSYEDLQNAGKTLEVCLALPAISTHSHSTCFVQGPALEKALKSLGAGAERPEDVEKEVKDMKERRSRLRKQLQALSAVQKSLQ